MHLVRRILQKPVSLSLHIQPKPFLKFYRTTIVSESEIVSKKKLPSGHYISVRQGDIVEEKVEALVNPTNAMLRHQSGLAREIVENGGEDIQYQSDQILREQGPVELGMVVVTTGGFLPAQNVIHGVTPVWRGGQENERELLKSVVRESLETARKKKWKSIAFPALGTGIYGYPKTESARLMIDEMFSWCLESRAKPPKDIRLINFDDPTVELFKKVFNEKFLNSQEDFDRFREEKVKAKQEKIEAKKEREEAKKAREEAKIERAEAKKAREQAKIERAEAKKAREEAKKEREEREAKNTRVEE